MTILENNKKTIDESIEVAKKYAHNDSVSIIAVTKTVDVAITSDLIDLGIKHIGENRVDKFLEKYDQLKEKNVTWHLIGSLQRRKVKDVINYVDYFHALDSVRLAEEIQKRAVAPVRCFLQVNLSGEKTKHGFSYDMIDSALEAMRNFDKVEIVGLMTMAPATATSEQLHHLFSQMASLREELQKKQLEHMPFNYLSMGMSNDYPIAIEHGANFVRIGRAFFEGLEIICQK